MFSINSKKRLFNHLEKTLSTLDKKIFEAISVLTIDERKNTSLYPELDEEKKNKIEQADTTLKIGITALAMNIGGLVVYSPLTFLSLGPIFFATGPIFQEGIDSLKKRKISVAVLDSFIAGCCIVTSNYLLYSSCLCIVNACKKLQYRTKGNTKQQLIDVFAQETKQVFILVNGIEISSSISDITLDDIIVVSAGQMIPVDGYVKDGEAIVDQHTLTGESQPVEKVVNSPVMATTIVLAGKIYISVERTGDDIIASQITNVLLNTTNFKSELQTKGEVLTDKTALLLLGTSLLSYPLFGIYGMLIIAIAPIGYDIRFTGSMGLLAYLNIASKNHILIKDGRALEMLKNVDTLVFDKTGTLTIHEPKVGKIYTKENYSKREVLRYAAAAESKQSHPIAKAILTKAQQEKINIPEVSDTNCQIGYGIQILIDNSVIHIGSERFFKKEHIVIDKEFTSLVDELESVILVAKNSITIGVIELQQSLRSEVDQVVDYFRNKKINLCIISGDQEKNTKKLAENLGIDSYYSETLPQDKAIIIEKLQKQGSTVCFVGDGINDSIALKKANVSISIKGATNVATDSADIILMNPDLRKICEVFELSHNFDKHIQKLFLLSFVPGLVMIGSYTLLSMSFLTSFLLGNGAIFNNVVKSLEPISKNYQNDS